MGTATLRHLGIADALFSRVQQRVLGLLFAQPERRFQSAELIRLAHSGTGAVHRILTRLAESGLVTVTRQGNQKYYKANRGSPVFPELHGLALKTFGIVDPIRRALAPMGQQIRVAFIYGSMAEGSGTTERDINLLVIGDRLRYQDVIGVLEVAGTTLRRTINPTVLTLAQWRFRHLSLESFTARLFVVGSEDDIA